MTFRDVQKRLRELSTPESAASAARFFKAGPGEYSAGDVFLGIRAADMRRIAREARTFNESEVVRLLHSKVHEDRLVALLIWVEQAARGNLEERTRICARYIANTHWVDNWDLVDASARPLLGEYILDTEPEWGPGLLEKVACSRLLWERRIAIVATHAFIRRGVHDHTLRIAEILLDDPHDLIHKAVGWMLREVGKRDETVLEGFLRKHGRIMPLTALRYAIERFPAPRRKAYLSGTACDPVDEAVRKAARPVRKSLRGGGA